MTAFRRTLNKPLRWIVILLFAVLALTVLWQVFTRQVLNSPAAWTDELARYSFVWLSLLGAALVFSEKGHIAVELLRNRARGRARRGVEAIVSLTAIFFGLWLLAYGGYNAAMGAWNQNATALPVQLGHLYLAMPIAGVIIALVAAHDLVLSFRGLRWDATASTPVPADSGPAEAEVEGRE